MGIGRFYQKNWFKRSVSLSITAVFFSCVGSVLIQEGQLDARRLLFSGRAEEALTRYREMEEALDSEDQLLYYLDAAMLAYYAEDWRNPVFERASEIFDRYEDKRLSLSSMGNPDPGKSYYGSVQENFWLSVFQSLAYWNQGGLESALVGVRSYWEKVDYYNLLGPEMESEAAERLLIDFRSALMNYLSMIYYRESGDERGWERARKALKEAEQNRFFYSRENLPESEFPERPGSLEDPAEGFVNLVLFSGLGVEKYPRSIDILTNEWGLFLRFTDTLQNASGALGLREPRLIKADFQVDRRGRPASFVRQDVFFFRPVGADIDTVQLSVDGIPAGKLTLIENFSDIQEAVQSELQQSHLRQNSKFGGMGKFGSGLGDLFLDFLVDSEKTDLRTQAFLPSASWIGELRLKAGPYRISADYRRGGETLHSREWNIEVEPEKTVLLQDFYAGY